MPVLWGGNLHLVFTQIYVKVNRIDRQDDNERGSPQFPTQRAPYYDKKCVLLLPDQHLIELQGIFYQLHDLLTF